MTTSITRRQSLKTLAALASIQIIPRHVLGGPEAPSNQLTRGIIGCGGISASHLGMPGKLLALCDVDEHHLKRRLTTVQRKSGDTTTVKGYRDFREVNARDDIDIIHVCTPPHWHAIMAVEAFKAGKDVWGEKPMSRTIGEGVEMVKAAAKYERIYRINTWFRFQSGLYGFKSAAKNVKKAAMHGLLGWPLKATVSGVTGFNWKFNWVGKTNLEPQPVPPHFDYDLWLGPAPKKPYNKHRTHATFRGYWDYDGGGLGDMGQHYLDPVQYILGKDDTSPVSVEIDADPQDADAVGTWRRIEFTYADGCQIILDGENKDKDAAFIEGPKGKIFPGMKSDIPDLQKKIDELPDPPAMITDFHESVRTRKKFALNEVNGFRSCSLVNLGKIAHRTNKSFRFEPDKLVIDVPECQALIDQPMRAPWKLEV